ncbi:hypothetical protein PPERSA_00643 [Pseudocohnilembus persalinus]|uniref:RING-type domain-containing protein n=1 Tax=Pseudocohnilembus persalinus TaxID=266149 RepID=A0A0V0QSQ2_PSEPJ|nr:hypothetical protein PPERSA_00643 [Pseudocohnilembus persalinus]|eukprot:KRX05342.1 hypothetical protein PPERSA_00643 [Pseudocohnilembus persalinus]
MEEKKEKKNIKEIYFDNTQEYHIGKQPWEIQKIPKKKLKYYLKIYYLGKTELLKTKLTKNSKGTIINCEILHSKVQNLFFLPLQEKKALNYEKILAKNKITVQQQNWLQEICYDQKFQKLTRKQVVEYPCKHVFYKCCVKKLLQAQKFQCPYCRYNLIESQIFYSNKNKKIKISPK